MKHIITGVCCLLGFLFMPTAQAEQVENDSLKANEYLQKANLLEDGNIDKTTLLEKAIAIYNTYDLPRKVIHLNSQLTYQYSKAENPKTIEFGEQNIAFAKTEFQDDKLPELALTYQALYAYLYYNDFENSVEYGEIALELLPKGEQAYFNIACKLVQYYTTIGDENALENIIQEIKQTVENEQKTTSKYANFTLYCAHFFYNYLRNNNDLILIYGKQLIQEIDEHGLEYEKDFYYTSIGLAYGEIGQLQEAIKWISKLKVTDDFSEANLNYYDVIADFYILVGNYEAAIPYLKQAISIYEKEKSMESQYFSREKYEELAYACTQLKQYQTAEKYILKAYEYEELYEDYIIDIYYAELLLYMQQYDKGLQYAQKALIKSSTNFSNTAIEKHPNLSDEFDNIEWTAVTLEIKTRLLFGKHKVTNDSKLLSLARQTNQLTIEILNQIQEYNRGYEREELYNNELISKALQLLQDIEYQQYSLTPNKQQLNTLFKITERCKSLTLLKSIAPEKFPKDVSEKEQQFINKVAQLEQTLFFLDKSQTDSIAYYRNLLTVAAYELENFQTLLLQKYPKQVAASYRFSYIDIATIQKNLPEETLWIEYAYNKSKTLLYIYYINQTTAELKTVPITADFFNDIEQLQRLLKDRLLIQTAKRKNFIETSHRLYQQLILPIEAQLKGNKNLYIVPEQTLFNLPFEVLLPNNELKPYESLDYIIRDFAIGYHYSATTFFNLQSKSTVKDQSLLAFAPVFDDNKVTVIDENRAPIFVNDSLYRSINNHKFKPLPNSKKEIETIHQLLSKNEQTTILLEKDATKHKLINALENNSYQYVHLATHGLVNFENYKLSALACFENNENSAALFFVNEIISQNINVDLVVLSSCESGVGQLIGSEGLIALNRSFIYAGAKNVIFSLWKVNDKYTSELMINFYTNQSKPIEYMEALRLAKLKLLAEPQSALPRYWAAFLIIGK